MLPTDTTEIKDRFLGFFDVDESKTADALYEVIINCIRNFVYKKLVVLCYDDGSVMAGSLNGLQSKI